MAPPGFVIPAVGAPPLTPNIPAIPAPPPPAVPSVPPTPVRAPPTPFRFPTGFGTALRLGGAVGIGIAIGFEVYRAAREQAPEVDVPALPRYPISEGNNPDPIRNPSHWWIERDCGPRPLEAWTIHPARTGDCIGGQAYDGLGLPPSIDKWYDRSLILGPLSPSRARYTNSLILWRYGHGDPWSGERQALVLPMTTAVPNRYALRAPDTAPALVPSLQPIPKPTDPAPTRVRPLPYRLVPRRQVNPGLDPVERSDFGYGTVSTQPATSNTARPNEDAFVKEDPRTITPTRPPIFHPSRTPGRGTKEKKMRAKPMVGALFMAAGKVTEFADFVRAIHDALPKKLQAKSVKPQDRLAALYRHIDEVDWSKAFDNVIKQEIEDRVWAAPGQVIKKGHRDWYDQSGAIVGREAGSSRWYQGPMPKKPAWWDQWSPSRELERLFS